MRGGEAVVGLVRQQVLIKLRVDLDAAQNKSGEMYSVGQMCQSEAHIATITCHEHLDRRAGKKTADTNMALTRRLTEPRAGSQTRLHELVHEVLL